MTHLSHEMPETLTPMQSYDQLAISTLLALNRPPKVRRFGYLLCCALREGWWHCDDFVSILCETCCMQVGRATMTNEHYMRVSIHSRNTTRSVCCKTKSCCNSKAARACGHDETQIDALNR